MSGYSPEPPRIPRPVTTTNFDEWCADPRSLTFEEYMAERIPVGQGRHLPPAPGMDARPGMMLEFPEGCDVRPVAPPLRGVR